MDLLSQKGLQVVEVPGVLEVLGLQGVQGFKGFKGFKVLGVLGSSRGPGCRESWGLGYEGRTY